ncbi:MAG TPA: hypothetical protein VFD58_25305 [Blastocatellia bacterium]|nr:hypothetical protein [Blastocatellia bacterium]
MNNVTLYQLADAEIRRCISAWLDLTRETHDLSIVEERHLLDPRKRVILLAGLGVRQFNVDASQAVEEWRRRAAIPFDLETAITTEVYRHIRELGATFLDSVERVSNGFTHFDPVFIQENPYLLPLLQHLAGVFSKSKLKELVGPVSDNSISKPAAQRMAKLLGERVDAKIVNKGEILQRLESTLEGIVRDLIGRVLLESVVASALAEQQVPFQREEEYSSLRGVVYDFRADFVIPDAASPRAFIEVRKSSSRHASLYAKDKMFSAINWKGNNPGLLAVLVVDGQWTKETLLVMARVFDYVVPIGRVTELVETLKAYLAGDDSKLKWLIEFRIERYNPSEKGSL